MVRTSLSLPCLPSRSSRQESHERSSEPPDDGPPLPRCVDVIPLRYAKGALVARRKCEIERRKQEKSLDFHGFNGDILGLRALLAHKYSGSSARGWRLCFTQDERQIKAVTFTEFCAGLDRLGYAGKALSLWKTLSEKSGGISVDLADFEPDLAFQLDAIARRWMKRFPQGAYDAWEDMKREHQLRATLFDFVLFLEESGMLQERPHLELRRIFAVLDVGSRGSITVEDLRFLDYWAHLRYNRRLPKPPQKLEKEVVEPWSPPPAREWHLPGISAFREHLKQHYGSPARAWRVVLDPKGEGRLSAMEFACGCRQANWKHPTQQLWRDLCEEAGAWLREQRRKDAEIGQKRSSSKGDAERVFAKLQGENHEEAQVVQPELPRAPAHSEGIWPTMRAVDPVTCGAIDEFNQAVREHFGDLARFWQETVDPGGLESVSRIEFVDICQNKLKLPLSKVLHVFMCLDTLETGYMTSTEIAFLEGAASASLMDGGSSQAQVDAALQEDHLLSRSQASFSKSGQGMSLASYDRGHGRSTTSSFFSTVGMGSNDAPITRTTRSKTRLAYCNAHMAKHQWLQSGAMLERSLHAAKGVPSTKLDQFSPEKNIFRTSHEFYREGVALLRSRAPEADDEEDYDT